MPWQLIVRFDLDDPTDLYQNIALNIQYKTVNRLYQRH